MGNLDSDCMIVLAHKVFGNNSGLRLQRQRAVFGHKFKGVPVVKPPTINIAGPFVRQPDEEVGDKVATASQWQSLGTLQVVRTMWEPLVERPEEKMQRQPHAPRESYEPKEYTLLDMIDDYRGLKKTTPLLLEHLPARADRSKAEKLVRDCMSLEPATITPQTIQHLAKTRRDLLQLCEPRNKVMEMPEKESLAVSDFWKNVTGDLTDE